MRNLSTLVLIVGGLLVGCGSPTYKKEHAEKFIKNDFAKNAKMTFSSVVCGADKPFKVGDGMDCAVETDLGAKGTVKITFKEGNQVHYELNAIYLTADAITEAWKKKAAEAVVACTAKAALLTKGGDKLSCKITVGEKIVEADYATEDGKTVKESGKVTEKAGEAPREATAEDVADAEGAAPEAADAKSE